MKKKKLEKKNLRIYNIDIYKRWVLIYDDGAAGWAQECPDSVSLSLSLSLSQAKTQTNIHSSSQDSSHTQNSRFRQPRAESREPRAESREPRAECRAAGCGLRGHPSRRPTTQTTQTTPNNPNFLILFMKIYTFF